MTRQEQKEILKEIVGKIIDDNNLIYLSDLYEHLKEQPEVEIYSIITLTQMIKDKIKEVE